MAIEFIFSSLDLIFWLWQQLLCSCYANNCFGKRFVWWTFTRV